MHKMIELAQAMVVDRTTLVRALRPLLHGGLVADASGHRDRRRLQLLLTSTGRTKLGEATAYWSAAQQVFEQQFGALQAAQLRRELFRITRGGLTALTKI